MKVKKVKFDEQVIKIMAAVGEKGETGEIGTPLVASSISGMTDTTRNYINTTNGHWYWYDGDSWEDGGVYQATSLDPTIQAIIEKSLHGVSRISTSGYTDANSLPNSTIYLVDNTTLLHLPVSGQKGTIITCNYDVLDTNTNGTLQIFVNENNVFSYRIKWASSWSSWKTHELNNLQYKGRIRYSGITDINNIPSNTIYMIDITTDIAHLPVTDVGTLITINGETGSNVNGNAQLFLSSEGQLYYRIRWSGSWTPWKAVIDKLNGTYNITLSMYNNIGVVGDSYASGSFGDSPSAEHDSPHYNYSWPAMLSRKNGFNLKNYSEPGLSTKTWLTNTEHGLSVLLGDDPQDLYILALIRNDYNRVNYDIDPDYLGSITDITGHSLGNYPDTFYGNYATIIENIQAHAPNAKLVMMTADYLTQLGQSFNTAMIEIAEHYNIPVMIQLEEDYFNSSLYRQNWPAGGHPGIQQYSGMALAIERMFEKVVNNNQDYFKYL